MKPSYFKRALSMILCILILSGSFPNLRLTSRSLANSKVDPRLSIVYDEYIFRLTFNVQPGIALPKNYTINIARSRDTNSDSLIFSEQITINSEKHSIKNIIDTITESTMLHIYLTTPSFPGEIFWATDDIGVPSNNYVYPPKNISMQYEGENLLISWEFPHEDYTAKNTDYEISLDGVNWKWITTIPPLTLLPKDLKTAFTGTVYIRTIYKKDNNINYSEVVSCNFETSDAILATLTPRVAIPDGFELYLNEKSGTRDGDSFVFELDSMGDYDLILSDGEYNRYIIEPASINVSAGVNDFDFAVLRTDLTINVDIRFTQNKDTIEIADIDFTPNPLADLYIISVGNLTAETTTPNTNIDISTLPPNSETPISIIPVRNGFKGQASSTTAAINGMLLGTVTDSAKNPILGAFISFDGQETISDEKGKFALETTKTGTFPLEINLEGSITSQEVTIDSLIENREFSLDGAKITGDISGDWSSITIFDTNGRPVFDTTNSSSNSFTSGILPFGEYVITAKNSDNSKALLESYTLSKDSTAFSASLVDASLISIYFSDKTHHNYTLYNSNGVAINAKGEHFFEGGIGLLLAADIDFITTNKDSFVSISRVSKTDITAINPLEGEIFFIDSLPINLTSVGFGDNSLQFICYGENSAAIITPKNASGIITFSGDSKYILPIKNGVIVPEEGLYSDGWIISGSITNSITENINGTLTLYSTKGETILSSEIINSFDIAIPDNINDGVLAFTSSEYSCIIEIARPTNGFLLDLQLRLSSEDLHIVALNQFPTGFDSIPITSSSTNIDLDITITDNNIAFIKAPKSLSFITVFTTENSTATLKVEDKIVTDISGKPLDTNSNNIPMLGFENKSILIGSIENATNNTTIRTSNSYSSEIYSEIFDNKFIAISDRSCKSYYAIFESEDNSAVLYKEVGSIYENTISTPISMKYGSILEGNITLPENSTTATVTIYNDNLTMLEKQNTDGYYCFAGIGSDFIGTVTYTDAVNYTALFSSLGTNNIDFYQGDLQQITLPANANADDYKIYTYSENATPNLLPTIKLHNSTLLTIGYYSDPVVIMSDTHSAGVILGNTAPINLRDGRVVLIDKTTLHPNTVITARDDSYFTGLDDRIKLNKEELNDDILLIYDLPITEGSFTFFLNYDDKHGSYVASPKDGYCYIPPVNLVSGYLLYGRSMLNPIYSSPFANVEVYDINTNIIASGISNAYGFYELFVPTDTPTYFTYIYKDDLSQIHSSYYKDKQNTYQLPIVLTTGQKLITPKISNPNDISKVVAINDNGINELAFAKQDNGIVITSNSADGLDRSAIVMAYLKDNKPLNYVCGYDPSENPMTTSPVTAINGNIAIIDLGTKNRTATLINNTEKITLVINDYGFSATSYLEDYTPIGVSKDTNSHIALDKLNKYEVLRRNVYFKDLSSDNLYTNSNIVEVVFSADSSVLLDGNVGVVSDWGRHYFTATEGEHLLTAQKKISGSNLSSAMTVTITDADILVDNLSYQKGELLLGKVVGEFESFNLSAYTKDGDILSDIPLLSSGVFCISGFIDSELLLVGNGTSSSGNISAIYNWNNTSLSEVTIAPEIGDLVSGNVIDYPKGDYTLVGYDDSSNTKIGALTKKKYYFAGINGELKVAISNGTKANIINVGEDLKLKTGELLLGTTRLSDSNIVPSGEVYVLDDSLDKIASSILDKYGRYLIYSPRHSSALIIDANGSTTRRYGELTAGSNKLGRNITITNGDIVYGKVSGNGYIKLRDELHPLRDSMFMLSGVPSEKYVISAHTSTGNGFVVAESGLSPISISLTNKAFHSGNLDFGTLTPKAMNISSMPLSTLNTTPKVIGESDDSGYYFIFDDDIKSNLLLFENETQSFITYPNTSKSVVKATRLTTRKLSLKDRPTAFPNTINLNGDSLPIDKNGYFICYEPSVSTPITATFNNQLYVGEIAPNSSSSITLSPSNAAIYGKLSDKISNAKVRVFSSTSGKELSSYTTYTDVNGSFIISNIAGESDIVLAISNNQNSTVIPVSLSNGPKILEGIKLESGKSILANIKANQYDNIYLNNLPMNSLNNIAYITTDIADTAYITNNKGGVYAINVDDCVTYISELLFAPLPPPACQITTSDSNIFSLADCELVLERVNGQHISSTKLDMSRTFYRPQSMVGEALVAKIIGEEIYYEETLAPFQQTLTLKNAYLEKPIRFADSKVNARATLYVPTLDVSFDVENEWLTIPALPFGTFKAILSTEDVFIANVEIISDNNGIKFSSGLVEVSDYLVIPKSQQIEDLEAKIKTFNPYSNDELKSMFMDLSKTTTRQLSTLSLDTIKTLEESLLKRITVKHYYPDDKFNTNSGFIKLLPLDVLGEIAELDFDNIDVSINWDTFNLDTSISTNFKLKEAYKILPTVEIKSTSFIGGTSASNYSYQHISKYADHFILNFSVPNDKDILLYTVSSTHIEPYTQNQLNIVPWDSSIAYVWGKVLEELPVEPVLPPNPSPIIIESSTNKVDKLLLKWIGHFEKIGKLSAGSTYSFSMSEYDEIPSYILAFLFSPTSINFKINGTHIPATISEYLVRGRAYMLCELEELVLTVPKKPITTTPQTLKTNDELLFEEEEAECIATIGSIPNYICNHKEPHSELIPISLQLFIRAVFYLGEFTANGGLVTLN